MKPRYAIFALHAAVLMVAISLAQEPSITVDAFGPDEAAVADQITINGPLVVDSGDTITCTLGGTPAVDLTKPLVDQLEWLMGADRMYCYAQLPGQSMIPLDVEATIVFAINGATMRPRVTFPAGEPGEYRLIVDWNYGQNQLVEHLVVVEGDEPDPFPEPDPDPKPDPDPNPRPVPPISEMFLMILEETDGRSTGLEGARLNQHLEEVAQYLRSLGVRFQIMDDDQEAAIPWVALLPADRSSRPVLLVTAPSTSSNRLIGVESFGSDSAATIQRLKAMGVK